MTLGITKSYLLLGGNIGDRVSYIQKAIEMLDDSFIVTSTSSLYETAAWGDRSQQSYLNVAVELNVATSAEELFAETRKIEYELGRREKGNYEPRTIDIDILFYGDKIIQTKKLIIPHERLHQRKFVLVPMNEIAPEWIHPIFDKNISTLLLECEDELSVKLLEIEKA